MRSKLLGLCLLVGMLIPFSARAGTRTDAKPYLTGTDGGPATCATPANYLGLPFGPLPGAGAACFALQGDELTASILIDDDRGWEVGGYFRFKDDDFYDYGSGRFCGALDNIPVPASATWLQVFVDGPVGGPYDCFWTLGSPGVGTSGVVSVTFETGDRPPPPPPPDPIDEETDCTEFVPHSAGVRGVTDSDQTVSLDVAVLLDGVSQQVAADAVAVTAHRSYSALGITFNAVSYESVSFTGILASGLIQQAKNHFGGKRPAGSDVVYVLTDKNIQSVGGGGVAGVADCIGGVEYPDRAFAVGEVLNSSNIGTPSPFCPFGYVCVDRISLNWYLYGTAKILSHEVGHLMGAHHHYSNCVEGIPTEANEGEASACTLMSNYVDFGSLNFSVVNGAVVRAHAVEYASP